MASGRFDGARSGLAWLLLPLVPAVLGDTYHRTINISSFGSRGGPDPRDWDWQTWLVLGGPLVGYGFLAGATAGLPDAPARAVARWWHPGRSGWVAVGPWVGFLTWAAVVCLIWLAVTTVTTVYPACRNWRGIDTTGWGQTWPGWLAGWALGITAVGTLAYGWLVVATVVLRQARRAGELRRSVKRGLAVAVGFIGSLFGSFWAITEIWRGYFFDPRNLPILIAAASLALLAGCSGPETYGEVRRRELFHSLLMAWLLGLALAWRWWARSRSRPPGPG